MSKLQPFLLLLAALLLWGCSTTPPQKTSPSALLGVWKVDLRPTPDARAYYKTFEVTTVGDRTFTGSFYDTPITDARTNNHWGALHFAFVTADQTGAYHHSGVLRNGHIEGMTNAIKRKFLSPWSAEKEP